MALRELLRMLADGEVHSGRELAERLGVSRTAVWKRLAGLEALGLRLESLRGRGYRLPGGLDLLDRQAILDALSEESRLLLEELTVLDAVDSTNSELLRRIDAGERASGLVCTAERQLAGRGRHGRAWVSPYAGNVYLSLGWTFAAGAAALEGLSLAAGVAACAALARLGLRDVSLKWPNDLLRRRAKLGGVLVEMRGDAAGPCSAVLGVGINSRMPAAAGAAIDQAWTDLASASGCAPPPRSQLVALLLDQLLPLLRDYGQSGFAPWRERWMALDACAGQPVTVLGGGREVAGIARGVDAGGALRLETALGMRRVHGGELSLRGAP